MTCCAIVVPVGPSRLDLSRARHLFDALRRYSNGVEHIVVAIDPSAKNYETLLSLRGPVKVLRHNRSCRSSGKGGLTADLLGAYRWLLDNSDAQYVVKLDVDAWVLRPFVSQLATLFREKPMVGLVGTVGRTCDRSVVSNRQEFYEMSDLFAICGNVGRHIAVPLRKALRTLEPHVEEAAKNGYFYGEYCQGGAYAISRTMLEAMARRGYLSKEVGGAWAELRFGEDDIIGMYTYATGFRLHDYSGPGQVFGISWRGLPYSRDAVLARGNAIIHSIKDDECYSESELRQYFRQYCLNMEPVFKQSSDDTGPVWIYGTHAACAALNNSGMTKLVLVGSYLGRPRFGSLSQLRATIRNHIEAGFRGDVFVVLADYEKFDRTLIPITDSSININIYCLFACYRPLAKNLARKYQLELVTGATGDTKLHCYGIDIEPFPHAAFISLLNRSGELFQPRSYILSSQQYDAALAMRMKRHFRRHRPDLIGCRNRETLRAIQDEGLDASLSLDDSVDEFSELQNVSKSAISESQERNRSFAYDLTCFPAMFQRGDLCNNPVLLRRALAICGAEAATLRAHYNTARPVLLNSGFEWRGRHNVMAGAYESGFTRLFPCCTHIDLVTFLCTGRLRDARALFAEQNVDRVISPDYHVCLWGKLSGLATFLLPLSGERSPCHMDSLAQADISLSDFMIQPTDVDLELRMHYCEASRRARFSWRERLGALERS